MKKKIGLWIYVLMFWIYTASFFIVCFSQQETGVESTAATMAQATFHGVRSFARIIISTTSMWIYVLMFWILCMVPSTGMLFYRNELTENRILSGYPAFLARIIISTTSIWKPVNIAPKICTACPIVSALKIQENFQYPYVSTGIREFWRRWHISLSTWFKEYLYIPLGGNRKGKVRTTLNKLVVFMATGIWHGATSFQARSPYRNIH